MTSAKFGKVGVFPVDGQIYAQPLYVSNLNIAGKGVRNVVFVVTMHNSVYAIDADAPTSITPLWTKNLGPSVPNSFLAFNDVQPEVGILSTPVIDPARGVIYVVSDTFEDGHSVFRVHALSLADGSEMLNGPTIISAGVPGQGSDNTDGVVTFNPDQHLQRPGLLLNNNNLYIGFGSHADEGDYHGWLLAYDAANLQRRAAIFNTSPDGNGGSIWQSGRGIASDQAGNLFVVSANGDYDGLTNYSESILKLSSSLALTDWFTPAEWQTLSDGDYDLGSTGAALIPGTDIVVGGDKFGTLFLVHNGPMGHLSPDNTSAVQSFQGAQWGGIFTFAMWGSDNGPLVFLPEQGTGIKAYRMTNGQFDTAPYATSSVTIDIPYNGIAVSANGAALNTGIVWVTSGDHSKNPAPGTLRAFDPATMTELWDSELEPDRDRLGTFAKFVAPTIANGKVYVPTFSSQLVIYGLLGETNPTLTADISAVVNAASYAAGAVSPGEVVTIFGSQMGPSQIANGQVLDSGLFSTQIEGTQVLFNGVAAPLLYVSANQIGAVIPYSVSGPSVQVQVIAGAQSSQPLALSVATIAPALFSIDGSGVGEVAAINQDGTPNSDQNPALPGTVVALYGTGLGQLDPSVADGAVAAAALPYADVPVQAQVGGADAPVLYAGAAPGMISGVAQINLQVPSQTPGGDIPVVLMVDGQPSQFGTTIAVAGAPSPQNVPTPKIRRRNNAASLARR